MEDFNSRSFAQIKSEEEYLGSLLYSFADRIRDDVDAKKSVCRELINFSSYKFDIHFSEENLQNNVSKYTSLKKLYRDQYDTYIYSNDGKVFLQNGRYKNEYEQIAKIGSGAFGDVFKVRNIAENQMYAIKKIPLLKGLTKEEINKKYNESQIWAKLENEFCVQYKTSWIEFNQPRSEDLTFSLSGTTLSSSDLPEEFSRKNLPIIHIQMELCLMDLREGMKKIHTELNYSKDNINSSGLLIASELFHEICAGVDYLHSQNPPIIHRDLKPANVLLTDGINGNFTKICDFGLATGHGHTNDFIEEQFNIKLSHTAGCGTKKYMAPEVVNGQKYDTSADVYSVGVIMGELFCIDSNVFNHENKNLFIGDQNVNKESVRKYLTEANFISRFMEMFIDIVYVHINLIHPDKNWRKFNSLKYKMIPFEKIKCDEDMIQFYCKIFASGYKPDINSLSDYILSKKINKYLEKESNEKKMISEEMKSNIETMEAIRANHQHKIFYTNIKDDELIGRIDKLLVCGIYTKVMFSEMKQFLEERLLELTSQKWIIDYAESANLFSNTIVYYLIKFGINSLILITDKHIIDCKTNEMQIIFDVINYEKLSSHLIESASKAVQKCYDIQQMEQIIENDLNKKYNKILNGEKFYCFVTKGIIIDDQYLRNNACLIYFNGFSIYASKGKQVANKILLKNIPSELKEIWNKIPPQDKKVIQHVINREYRLIFYTKFFDSIAINDNNGFLQFLSKNNISNNIQCVYCINPLSIEDTDIERHIYKLEYIVLYIYY